MARLTGELTTLIQRINRTNAATELEPGRTLSDALAVRDMLGWQHSAHRDLAQTATITQTRYSKSEVRFESTVDIAAIQQQADRLAQEYRELDTRIQAANWLIDLLE
jgi:hypothetical protein